MTEQFEGKIIAVNKPKGMTSHDVVNLVRKITGIKKVGHAGTLDPLATGVLVIAIGRSATKQLSTIVKKEKEYIGVIKLGEESTTDDQEGIKVKISNLKFQISNEHKNLAQDNQPPKLDEIKKVLKQFVGTIQQVPPQYSAVKVAGKKAYNEARKGRFTDLKARLVEIKKIELLEYQYPFLKLKVTTGPGVYIRSLARDIGKILGTGAYLFDLQRTRVGEFTIEQALSIQQIEKVKE